MPDLIAFLTARIEQAGLLAPLLAALVGVVLTLTPIAWPSVPAVVALVAPARVAAKQDLPAAVNGPRGFAVVLGFVIGMDGVVATLSAAFFGVLVVLTRAAVVLTVVAIVLLTVVGVRLLLARGPAVCRRLEALPPDPLRAVSAGVAFSVTGCPGCAPVSDDPRKSRRVDKVLAAVLLLSAVYYAWRLFDGQVITTLPGEGGLLP